MLQMQSSGCVVYYERPHGGVCYAIVEKKKLKVSYFMYSTKLKQTNIKT
jgi:hypothetical protein